MRRPEILAPAGDRDAMAAALAAGADAIYFGLDDGFNARARAENFPSNQLAEVVAWIHRGGARAYVTLNTLVFEPELPVVEELIRRVAAAGTDAIIVQDPAVALLARAICPALEVHASTQMTASSGLAVTLLRELGLSRVVVPRELSVDEIRQYRAATDVELEVFVHGALCVAWSGQCLSSEAWGGRSANRGQCAQACRLPYSLVVDGAVRDLGEVEYLLSPKDLVGLDAIPELAEIGVASLKIEGRLKGPGYVATAVAQYRRAAALAVGETAPPIGPASSPVDVPLDRESLHVAYSRGISPGFLGGADHQTLVEGRFPRHRGLPLGRVVEIDGDEVEVVDDANQRPVTGGLAVDETVRRADSSVRATDSSVRNPDNKVRLSDVRAGMGVVFDAGTPDQSEQGGPIFAVARTPKGHRLRFGDPGPDLSKVRVGDFVWVSSDPKVTRAGDKAAEAGRAPLGRIAIALEVSGRVGEPLRVHAQLEAHRASAHSASVRAALEHHAQSASVRARLEHHAQSASVLAAARGGGITRELLADKLGALGGTPFHLGTLDTSKLDPGLHLPVSELKEIRRTLVVELDAAVARVERNVVTESVIASVRSQGSSHANPRADQRADQRADERVDQRADQRADDQPDQLPTVVPLCRDDAQLDAVLDAGATEVELDWMELVGLARAVERARARGARVTVATVRVQKPGEDKIDAHLARLEPDAVLVRSWGSLAYFEQLARTHVGSESDNEQLGRTHVGSGSDNELARAHVGSEIDNELARAHVGSETDNELARAHVGNATDQRADHDPLERPRRVPVLHGDFSLNVTNSITAGWVLGHGLATLTAAHDLDREQLFALLDVAPRGRVAVTVHHHIPTFHTEHCVYAHLLSTGRDFRTCGRPCEQHKVALRDRVGLVHPVIVDVGCRNTVFNAQAQSAAALVPELLARGVRRFRVELVRETAEEAKRVYTAYAQLVAGVIAPADVVRVAAVHEQFGVTRGTMRTLTVVR
ncbi:MAG TPA: U32 family peptidase [Kofleriaceae bacterium]